jgi:hypothetical protein
VRPSTARCASAQDEANFLCAIKTFPHPELVEGRMADVQRISCLARFLHTRFRGQDDEEAARRA